VKPLLTIEVMGWWPIISGILLLYVSFIMYAAAFENVKHAKFENFW
jgi:hypothetical protein